MRFRVYGLLLSKRAYFCQASGGRSVRLEFLYCHSSTNFVGGTIEGEGLVSSRDYGVTLIENYSLYKTTMREHFNRDNTHRNNFATGSSEAPGSMFSVFLKCTASGIRSTKSFMFRILPLSFFVARLSPQTPTSIS